MLANCSGRTAQQLDTELFGCEPGAYPGAERRRIGKLEQASGGTLILDEVTELPLETQAKLLRFLEQSQFERLGGSETLTCPVRILAITQPALEQLVESGKFRRDLYFRLRGLTISLPPLRERRQDIPELAHYFLFRFNRSLATTVHSISEEVLERFDLYGWPGNVRELRNCIRESLVRSSGPVLAEEFLPGELTRQTPEAETEAIEVSADVAADWSELAQQVESGLQARERGLYRRVLRLFDRILVRGALQQTEGNQAVAAELLGLSRPTLRGKIRNMRSAAGSP
jgi:two-component system nitrogen regulation response regulator GlnG